MLIFYCWSGILGWGYGKGLNSVPEQFKGGNLIEIKWGG